MSQLGKCPTCSTPLVKITIIGDDGKEQEAWTCSRCNKVAKTQKSLDKWGMEPLQK